MSANEEIPKKKPKTVAESPSSSRAAATAAAAAATAAATAANEQPEGLALSCRSPEEDDDELATSNSQLADQQSIPVQQRPKLPFKNPKFSYIEAGGKKFVWKSLKQIVTQEKSLSWPEDSVIYSVLNAPPSLKPPKKYSDLSGLEAPYTDPQTKLHYHNSEEFRIIRTLPSDIIQGYLALRGATNIVG